VTTMVTIPALRSLAKWRHYQTAYRVWAIRYGDGSDGLVIEVFGPGSHQRSVIIRGDVAGIAPAAGWQESTDAQRTEVVEALFDPRRWN